MAFPDTSRMQCFPWRHIRTNKCPNSTLYSFTYCWMLWFLWKPDAYPLCHSSDRQDACPVEVLIKLAGLNKFIILNIFLHLLPWAHKVVVLPVDLGISPWTGCICRCKQNWFISTSLILSLPQRWAPTYGERRSQTCGETRRWGRRLLCPSLGPKWSQALCSGLELKQEKWVYTMIRHQTFS